MSDTPDLPPDPSPASDPPNPREDLEAAIQAFAIHDLGHPVVVVGAVVVYETASYGEGEVESAIRYALPMSAQSMSGALGLAAAGRIVIAGDLGLYAGSDEDEGD